ncbi:MAG: hypothetical protein BJ554DRAFT_80 [Olpidium bornovanus]|uniref:Uncharacterized protein n=1 Tax=Olpidium bornovanus TaxID=278681 RepID=A0A8H7ZTU3_9FUNG|nr:MAG: hypothetical protein BJ554DRAFT_80 [Olpidium bornovanus]
MTQATLVDAGSSISAPKNGDQADYPAEFLGPLQAADVSPAFPPPIAADSWFPHHQVHGHHHGLGGGAYDRGAAQTAWASRRPAAPVGRCEADEPLLHFNAYPEHPSTYTVTQISRDAHKLRKELKGIIKDGERTAEKRQKRHRLSGAAGLDGRTVGGHGGKNADFFFFFFVTIRKKKNKKSWLVTWPPSCPFV